MLWAIAKTMIAASVISFASWLSNKRPDIAGFIIALPIGTMLVLLFSYAQYQDPVTSVKFAKSIFAAIPLSLLFFVPFLVANKLPLGFWGLYATGIALLVVGYFTHAYITRQF